MVGDQSKPNGGDVGSSNLELDVKSRPLTEVGPWRFFSENPDKAWAEKVFLGYSPIWPILFFSWCKSGLYLQVGDETNLFVTLLIASPNVVIPLLFGPKGTSSISEQYWFKFLVWMWIYSFVASYFFSEYFFDVLKMVYAFDHLKWNLDSVLVGSGKQGMVQHTSVAATNSFLLNNQSYPS